MVNDIILYHGTNKDFELFSLDFMGVGHDENGAGIYLTDDLNEAKMYGDVKTIKIKDLKVVACLSNKDVDFMVKNCEDLDDVLSNWAEDKIKALGMLMYGLRNSTDSLDLINSVWYELYKNNNKLFCENMVKLGYDCCIVEKVKSKNYIFYNVNKLNEGVCL